MTIKRNNASIIRQISTEFSIFTNTLGLSDKILAETNQLLRLWGMTALQYHALKFIYVNETDNKGLSSSEIGQSLYTRVPDVTRLLDRLADKGWVTRERDKHNRRVVRTSLTQIGCELVESAAMPLKDLELKQLDHLTELDKKNLLKLLKKAVNPV